MTKLFLIISFCSIGAVSSAQKKFYAKLQLIYPEQLTYDTLLVKDAESKMVSETSTLKRRKDDSNLFNKCGFPD